MVLSKTPVRIGKADGELSGRQVRLLKGQVNDRRFDLVGDLVPDPSWSGLVVFQSLNSALLVSAVPFVNVDLGIPIGVSDLLTRPSL